MTTKIYGAYGSNINLKQMEIRYPFAKVYGIGRIENYRLTFRRGGYANIEKSEGGSVPLLLWEITERCEESLNVYEGYPRFYIKENITVLTDEGEEIEAMFYVMNEDARGDFELPKPYYYFGIEEGCRVNDIPTGTLEDALERCRAEVQNKKSSKN